MRKVLTAILLFIGLNTFGQVHVPFESRPSGNSIKVKGNYTFLSNSILNRYDRDNNANVAYNGEENNNDLHRDYIDIDADDSTFSSSAAELSLPDCSQIVYAGLYWAGNYDGEVSNNSMIPGIPRNDNTRNPVNAIKLKVPGSSAYVDVIADNNPDAEGEEDHIIIDDPSLQNAPYVCYANVTNQIQSLASANGTYTVANVRGTRGQSVGGAAGWTMVIVYENDAETNKTITFFDGYAAIQANQAPVELTVSGFKTIENGPVAAKLGVAAVEGDRSFSGDKFLFATKNNPNYIELGNTLNPQTNFFKSNITDNDQIAQGLLPSSENTLGYDSDLFDLDNTNNSIIGNGEEEAYFKLETLNDTYSAFLIAFGVEVIDPQVDLIQNIIYNNSVFADLSMAKGEAFQLQHRLSNTGNDEVGGMTVEGVVPQQFELLESDISLPSGINYTYDASSRLLSLTFDANTITSQELVYTLPFQVTDSCSGLMGPCGNLVDFQMNTSYTGVVNPALKESVSSTEISNCSLPNYAANSITLTGLEDCDAPISVDLCDGDAALIAAEGYSDYIWKFDQNQSGALDASDPVVASGTNTFSASYAGLFFVEQITDDPDCSNTVMSFDVNQSGFIQNNPLIPYINGDIANYNGTIYQCEDTNEEIPIFYLCDDGSSYDFNLNLNGVVDYKWEKLDPNCENADLCGLHENSCDWQPVTNSPNYTVSEGGVYRINLTQEDGCTTNYFFRVDQLDYNPEVFVEDHRCTTLGSIEIANLSDQFRFRLIDPISYQILRDFQDSPVFEDLTEGVYSVEIESNLEGNACVYYIDLIEIEEIETEDTFYFNQIGCDDLGNASLELQNVIGQNTFSFFEGSTLISEITTEETSWSVADLTEGTYRVLAVNEYGCEWEYGFTIEQYDQMSYEGFDVTEIGCQEAELDINIQGGVAPYSFALMANNGQVFYNDATAIPDSAFNNSPDAIADRNTNNTYTYAVKDAKGCIIVLPEIVVEDQELFDYTLATENLLCDGTVDGSVTLTVTEFDGYEASFNLSGGTYNSTNDTGLFESLEPGNYTLEITKTKNGDSCIVTENIIIEPAPVVQFSHQQISCEDLAAVSFTSEDTTAVFGYDIFLNGSLVDSQSNLANQITVDGLGAGDYNIIVYNDQNCSWEYPFNITDYQEMTFVGFDVTEIGCQEAELDINIQGGVAPYSFALMANNGQVFYNDATAIPDSAFNNSPDAIADRNTNNTYTYAVKDAKGCIIILPEIVVEDQELFDYTLTTENLLCDGTVDGSVTLTVTEFDGYEASFNLSGGTYNSTNDTGLFESLEPGNYTLEITKTKNGDSCIVTENIIIEPAPVVQFSHQQISCEDLAAVSFTSEDTTAVFGYDIFLNGSLVDSQSNLANQITVDGLGAGDYNIIVYNDQNCSWEYPFNITDYQEMTFVGFDVTEIGCQEAELTINIEGGVAPYMYALIENNGNTNNTNFNNIQQSDFSDSPRYIYDRNTNNTYTYAVKDAKGCIIVLPEIVVEDQELFDYTLATENLLCDGTVDGSVTLTVTEFDGYEASFNLSGGTYNSTNDTGLFESLEPGNYTLEITKTKNGDSCVVTENIIIEPAPVVQFSHQQISCEDLAAVSFTSEDTTAVFGYDIFLNGSLVDSQSNLANQITVDGLGAGDYNIIVYNDQNCSWEYPFNITDYQEMTFVGFDVTEIGCQEAELDINIQGGVAPYSFALMANNGQVFYNDATAIPDSAFNNSPDAIADRNTNNTYTYAVKDAKGCIIILPEIVVEDQELFDYTLATENLLCDGTVDGSVTLTVTEFDGYEASFNLSGGTYNSTNDTGLFESLEPGNYTLEITKTKNGDSCVVTENIIIEPAPVVQFSHQQISCEDLAAVSFTSEDTTAVFGYDIFLNGSLVDSQSNLANQITVDGLGAGDYNIIVYNDQNCSWEYPFNITDYQEMTFVGFDVTEIGCQEAELDINIQGGVAPYSFALMANNGQVFYNDATAIPDSAFNNSPDAIADRNTNNTYTYAVKDAKGCIIILPEIVVEDQELFDYTLATENLLCDGTVDGSVTLTVTEFDGYEASFNLSGGTYNSTNDTGLFESLEPGNYTLEITKTKNGDSCVVTENIIIDPAPVVQFSHQQISCEDLAAVSFTSEDTTAVFGYDIFLNGSLVDSQSNLANQITVEGLGAGDYNIIVYNDQNCSWEYPFNITDYQEMTFVGFDVTEIGCQEAELDINIQGGVAPYSFALMANNGQVFYNDATAIPDSAFNNSPDAIADRNTNNTYTYAVKDAKGCIIVLPEIVVEDQELFDYAVDVQGVGCFGESNGVITLDIIEADGYELSTSLNGVVSESLTFTDLSAGQYTLEITKTKEGESCVVSEVIEITQPDSQITSTVDVGVFSCESGADIEVSSVGGVGPYQYELWFEGQLLSQNDQNGIFNNLSAPGEYTIITTDANGCGSSDTIQIEQPDPVEYSISVSQQLSCTDVAQISLNILQTSTYTVQLLDANGAVVEERTAIPDGSHVFEVADFGAYKVLITDDISGCETESSSVTVLEPTSPNINLSAAEDYLCDSAFTTSLALTASNYEGDYTVDIFKNGSLWRSFTAAQIENNTITGVETGEYYAVFNELDFPFCSATTNAVVIDAPVIPLSIENIEVSTASCSYMDDGTLEVAASGGSGTLTYTIVEANQSNTTGVFENVPAGVFTVTVTDEQGCIDQISFEVRAPEELSLNFDDLTGESCLGSNDGSASFSVTGGSGVFEVFVNNELVAAPYEFNNLAPGVYDVEVIDSTGCNLNGSFEITPGVTLSATVAPIYLCGDNDVFNAIDIIVEGADQNLVFALDSSDPAEAREDNYFENLSPGEHFVSVIHPNGCAEIVAFEIDYFEPLALSIDLTTPNQARTVVTGGEGPFEIFINEDYDTPIASEDGSFDYPITSSGIESFTVIDAKGCVQTVSAELTFYDIEIPNYFTPNNDGVDDTWKVTNSFAYGDIDVRVFDRYGRLLISMKANQVWDGTYKGAPLPNGDYWYVVRLNSASNPLEKMGHFTLYR